MAFPYAAYQAMLVDLMPTGADIMWKGSPEPFYTPIGNSVIVAHIDVGDTHGYGTSEVRRTWVDSAMNGDGAFLTYVLQRMTWPLKIEVESFDADNPGESYLMELRGKLRWPTNVQRIQDMGLTTVRVGDVRTSIRVLDDRQTFVAVLDISHGQCFVSQATDDDGNVIDLATATGTLTGGNPDPITVTTTATST